MQLKKLNPELEIPCYHCGRFLSVFRAQLTNGIAIVNLCLCAKCACLGKTELLGKAFKRR